jgi:hypothetical protein
MTLITLTNGNLADADQVMYNFVEAYTISGLNLIRQLQDRSVTFSKGTMDWFGDAYIDTTGRLDSVNTGSTTALYDSNSLVYYNDNGTVDAASGDSTSDPDSFTNAANAFDGNDATYAEKTNSSGVTLGKTFSAKNVGKVKIKAEVTGMGSASTGTIKLQTYNGSTWSDYCTLGTGADPTYTYNGTVFVNLNIQGIRVHFSSTDPSASDMRLYTLEYYTGTSSEKIIVQAIPSGTFGATISSAIGVPMIYGWETGGDIQYKLTNGSEDSGYLSCGNTPTISSFTAFTSEPTTLTIKLIPKGTTPTCGYPALKGFSVRAA